MAELREAADRLAALMSETIHEIEADGEAPTVPNIADRLIAAGVTLAPVPTDAPGPGLRITGRDVHREWRDGMLAQGRDLAPERMAWETLDQRDRDLDDRIAAALAASPAPSHPEGLDVERLARALHDETCAWRSHSGFHAKTDLAYHEESARRILARLSNTTTEASDG